MSVMKSYCASRVQRLGSPNPSRWRRQEGAHDRAFWTGITYTNSRDDVMCAIFWCSIRGGFTIDERIMRITCPRQNNALIRLTVRPGSGHAISVVAVVVRTRNASGEIVCERKRKILSLRMVSVIPSNNSPAWLCRQG